jgi:hypothetical protein
VPAVDLSDSGINLLSDDEMAVQMIYNGVTLTMTITDMVTAAVWSNSWTVNIPSILGSNTAYVGFTGSTGTAVASQKILTWSFVSSATLGAAAIPSFAPMAGTYTSAQSVAISDSTGGAIVYYTVDGTVPTTASTLYSGAIPVGATETLRAVAVATGSSASAIGTATYTITPLVLPAPIFSPAVGTYATAQVVSISEATAGTTIHYTTDGTAPTISSAVYSGAITVSASETLKALAVRTGYTNSPVTAATYTISAGSTANIDYASGGVTASNLSLNNGAAVAGGALNLTDGAVGELRSAWFTTKVPVTAFTTDFTFLLQNAFADGFTFTIQNAPKGIWALGDGGGGLGYQSIPNSIAVKFDLYSNAGEGVDSTGLYTGGATPTVPSVDLSSTGINLHSGDLMHAHMVYDGTNLTMALTDTVTSATVSEVFPVNIPGLIGSNNAYVGFTASSGSTTATQKVLSWTYLSQ